MTPITLFVSILLYVAAILLPGGKTSETKTCELQKVGEFVQEQCQESTQKEHTQL